MHTTVTNRLKAHTARLHLPMDQRNHKCTFDCGSYFETRGERVEHEKVHEGGCFRCMEETCMLKFATAKRLQKHYRNVHTATAIKERGSKQDHFAEFLREKNIRFRREYRVDLSRACPGATWCRVDFTFVENGILVLVELDENQHASYPVGCESIRPLRISDALTVEGKQMPMAFIRLNPDNYRSEGRPGNVPLRQRYEVMMKLIQEWEPTEKRMEVQYCFYDVDQNGKLMVSYDTDYEENTLEILVRGHEGEARPSNPPNFQVMSAQKTSLRWLSSTTTRSGTANCFIVHSRAAMPHGSQPTSFENTCQDIEMNLFVMWRIAQRPFQDCSFSNLTRISSMELGMVPLAPTKNVTADLSET
jgi:hypothetical protein